MGGASAGGGGNNRGDRDTYNPVTGKQYSKPKKNPVAEFIKGGGITGAIIKSITDTNKKTKTKKQANVEVGLGKDRMSNYSVNEGGTRETGGNDGGGNNNTPIPKIKVAEIPKVKTAPTEAEVSQSAATDTTAVAETKKEDDIYTRKRKAKAIGRSMMTLTSAQGVKDNKLTLGKPSLLGS